jgi:hypothetical protein
VGSLGSKYSNHGQALPYMLMYFGFRIYCIMGVVYTTILLKNKIKTK